MFTKKDLELYLKQIKKIERKMHSRIDFLMKNVNNDRCQAILSDIKKDELRHERIVKELIAML